MRPIIGKSITLFAIIGLVLLTSCAGNVATVAPVAPILQGVAPPRGAVELPPLPDSVPSALGLVPVIWKQDLRSDDGQSLLGFVQMNERRIYLNSDIKHRVTQWQILFHERCHITLNDAGLRFAIPGQIIQQLCDVLATAQVADMIATAKR